MKKTAAMGLVLGWGMLSPGPAGANSLFDGETLAGWHAMLQPGDERDRAPEENFFVKNGAIVCSQTEGSQGGLLLTEAAFVDFDLVLEFQSDWGCESGVLIRCTEEGQGIRILNDYREGGNVGGIFGQGTGEYLSRPIELFAGDSPGSVVARDLYDGVEVDGLVYSIDAQGWNSLWKPDDWNTLRVRCVGAEPRIITWLNSVKVMEMDGRLYRARHLEEAAAQNWDAPSAWDRERVEAITGNAGAIGLQIQSGNRWKPGGSVRYRNIRISPVR